MANVGQAIGAGAFPPSSGIHATTFIRESCVCSQRIDKDAADFLLLISNYHAAGNEDRLYEVEVELLAAAGYDLEIAGAMLLGKDAAQLCSAPTAARLTVLFANEHYHQRLLDQMIRQVLLGERDADAKRVADYLKQFHLGFDQALKKGAPE